MNIIVTNEGKHHVNQLLVCLGKQGWLQRFYVGFASNRLLFSFRQIKYLEHWLRKKEFTGFDTTRIRSFYVSTLIARLATAHTGYTKQAFWLFDKWVAKRLHDEPNFDLLIGYENCNLLSFQVARKLHKITVLDLAQVHHLTIEAIQCTLTIADFTETLTAHINQQKQAALDLTDYILTLSSFATRSLTDNGIARDRIYEVNLGIDPAHFQPADKPVDGRFRVLFTGTITYRKGIAQLISAFKELQLPGSELLLIGPIGDAKALVADCTGSIRHIPFLHHDELVGYYQQADIFVFPSYLDSWGQVVLEAMACGTPVIVSDNTGAKDAVAKGGGFIIPTGDEAALREKIRYFYESRSEVDRLGQEARRVAEQYTWNSYYQQVAAALTDIAHRENIPL